MCGYVYKITDLYTNKIYIGKHKATAFESYKYLGSGKIIKDIVKKCKSNNQDIRERLLVEMLDIAETPEELNEKEIYYIELYSSNDRDAGYNLTSGGDGGDTVSGKVKATDGHSEMLVEKGGILPDGFHYGTKHCGENHPAYGRDYRWATDGENCIQISPEDSLPCGYHYGRPPMSDEQKKLLSQHHNTYRNNFSEEILEKFRINFTGENNPQVKNPKYGKDNPFFGKHHTEEAKRKNREAHLVKHRCPYCEYVSTKSVITRHIKKAHKTIVEGASTTESIVQEKNLYE